MLLLVLLIFLSCSLLATAEASGSHCWSSVADAELHLAYEQFGIAICFLFLLYLQPFFVCPLFTLMGFQCRFKPAPPLEALLPLLPTISTLLFYTDAGVVANVCWALR
jgi:hypothetical protein